LLSTTGPRAVIIYDCFSLEPDAPAAKPIRNGFAALAERAVEKGDVPWAALGGGDSYWARVVQDAGFVLRYTLVSRITLAGRRVRKITGSSSVHVVRR